MSSAPVGMDIILWEKTTNVLPATSHVQSAMAPKTTSASFVSLQLIGLSKPARNASATLATMIPTRP